MDRANDAGYRSLMILGRHVIFPANGRILLELFFLPGASETG